MWWKWWVISDSVRVAALYDVTIYFVRTCKAYFDANMSTEGSETATTPLSGNGNNAVSRRNQVWTLVYLLPGCKTYCDAFSSRWVSWEILWLMTRRCPCQPKTDVMRLLLSKHLMRYHCSLVNSILLPLVRGTSLSPTQTIKKKTLFSYSNSVWLIFDLHLFSKTALHYKVSVLLSLFNMNATSI